MRLVAGIDGGATNTRAVLVSEDGSVLGAGWGGPSNQHSAGISVLQESIQQALNQAWQQAGIAPRTCDGIFLGMAGASNEAEHALIRKIAADLRLAPDNQIHVSHDIRIAQAGGLCGQEGIALIVGTGSACYGRRDDGREWRCGGRGCLLDDMGSSYYLGLQAMVAATRGEDRRGEPTALTDALLSELKISDLRELVRRVYAAGDKSEALSRVQIAALAPMVISVAASGDRAALGIIREGVSELSWMVQTIATQLEFPPAMPVTVQGGLAISAELFKRMLNKSIHQRLPSCRIVEPILSPVMGAALLALEHLDVKLSESVLARLRQERAGAVA